MNHSLAQSEEAQGKQQYPGTRRDQRILLAVGAVSMLAAASASVAWIAFGLIAVNQFEAGPEVRTRIAPCAVGNIGENMATKERLLKKYEAEARACATDAGDPPMDFYSPFGPMIAKTTLPGSLLDRVNRYADGVAAPGKGMEFLLPAGLVTEGGSDSIAQCMARFIRRYLAGMENTAASKVEFEVFWVVSQYAGTPSPVHFHSADISGVLYLKVPEIDAAEEAKTYISGRHAGYINFLIGGKQRFSKSLISFRPEVGDFYIFPGWLLHGAEPFRGEGERRSMSFNATVSGGES